MTPTIGILILDGVEELDFVGPWEVLCAAAYEREGTRILLIAEREGPVNCATGMRVLPDATIGDAPRLDIVLVPGGEGTRRDATGRALLDWIVERARTCQWVTSVCTGSLLLAAAGLCDGKRMTTHWEFVPALRALGRGEVLDGPRYVRDGNLVRRRACRPGSTWRYGWWARYGIRILPGACRR